MERSNNVVIGAVIAVLIIAGGIWFVASKDDKKADDTKQTAQTTKTEEAAPTQNIVEIASGNPDFSTLVEFVKTAGLVDTLSSAGPFTVFAPTNEAFARLPADTVAALKADPAKLKEILTYHVVSGSVLAADVVKLDKATTVQGKDVKIMVMDGKVMLNDSSTVTKTDIKASNGVIHVIDTVLLPPTN
jgi:uncharacterized surface protein with fasciclin (FAS1) repeats